jgi:cytochrome c oxidase assembly protein subunit 15
MQSSHAIRNWLFIGLVLVFFQVVIGGLTRLTESGLSITKWEVVSGTLPPLSDQQWIDEFELYKQTPQYKEINEGMSLSDFKFIYFWEYFHRLWARLMGFVFIIPFVLFWRKGMISKKLLGNLIIVILLAISAATFGWIMVASGLIDRPWVNAYKLSIHLSIAFAVFGYLMWTYLEEKYSYPEKRINMTSLLRWVYIFGIIYSIQLFLGGMMSGMKIAVVYPSWPDMNGEMWPSVLSNAEAWKLGHLNAYDKNEFAPALIHFFHRGFAYLLVVFFAFIFIKIRKNIIRVGNDRLTVYALNIAGLFLFLQVVLGISTVLLSQGRVPVWIGVLHQAGALLLLSSIIYLFFVLKRNVE